MRIAVSAGASGELDGQVGRVRWEAEEDGLRITIGRWRKRLRWSEITRAALTPSPGPQVPVVAVLWWDYGWVPVLSGLAGACALLYCSLLLVREARLAIGFTLKEMDFLRDVVARAGRPPR